jgi:hypothetical protein
MAGISRRLWGEQRRRREARDLLAFVHSSFTKGADTAEVQETKMLFNQLS